MTVLRRAALSAAAHHHHHMMLMQVWMTAADGLGWTRDEDGMGPAGACCGAANKTCCPQVRGCVPAFPWWANG